MIQYYELIYIIPVKFAGKEFDRIQNKIKEIIQKAGGQICYEENLGKKKLSYAIKRNSQGFYMINEFEIESDKIQSINAKIKLMSEIIRHLILKKKKLTDEERKKEHEKKERQDKREDKQTTMADQFDIEKQLEDISPTSATIKEAGKQQEKLKEGKTETTADNKISMLEKKKEEKKIRLEDLDKKLDTIINDNLI